MRGTETERETLEALFMEGTEAWNQRDFDRFVACFHPKVEYQSLLTRVEGGAPYRGHGGLRRYWDDLGGAVEHAELAIDTAEWIDDAFLISGKVTGTGRASGAPYDYDCVQAVRFREGLICWCATFTTRREAIAAARGE
jgi:ketosteroid isomerase-like protein